MGTGKRDTVTIIATGQCVVSIVEYFADTTKTDHIDQVTTRLKNRKSDCALDLQGGCTDPQSSLRELTQHDRYGGRAGVVKTQRVDQASVFGHEGDGFLLLRRTSVAIPKNVNIITGDNNKAFGILLNDV